MMAHIGDAVAAYVASMLTLMAIVAAVAVGGVLVYLKGREDERRAIDKGRAKVRAAMEHAQAETVVIPGQRVAVER